MLARSRVTRVVHLRLARLRRRRPGGDDRCMSIAPPISLMELMKDPAVREDPYPTYAAIREMGRLVPTLYGGLIVTRHEDAFAVLRDARFSSNPSHQMGAEQFAELARQVGLGDLQDMFGRVMLNADPPDHTRLRRLVSKAFTP